MRGRRRGGDSSSERKDALKRRQDEAVKNRSRGGSNRSVLDLEGYDDVGFFKAVKGNNEIDIIPFPISCDWYPTLLAPNGTPVGVNVGEQDYKLEIPVHFGVGVQEQTMLCLKLSLNKKCPICEEMDATEDDNIKGGLKPKWRCIYNIIDLKDESKGIQLWDVSRFLLEVELLDEIDAVANETLTVFDLEDGRSIAFRATPKRLGGREFLEYKAFKFNERDAYDESIMEKVFPLDKMLKIPTYEEVQKAFFGGEGSIETERSDDSYNDSHDKQEESEQEEPKPSRREGTRTEHAGMCPSGGDFGGDWNQLEECKECPDKDFDKCADKHDKMEKEKPAPRKRSK